MNLNFFHRLVLTSTLFFTLALNSDGQVRVNINFRSPSGVSATDYSFGLNIYKGFEPSVATNDTYQSRLNEMQPGIVRWHRQDMIKDSRSDPAGWAVLDPIARTAAWDIDRIAACMMPYRGNATFMVNIPKWPDFWQNAETNRLLPEYYDEFANWCADLLWICNRNLGLNVRYWELPNEQDLGGYADFESSAELGRVFVACASKMRATDNTILVGGPAMALPWVEHQPSLDGFLSTAANSIDFVSYHSYDTGDPATTTSEIFAIARESGWPTEFVRTRVQAYTNRPIEYFHTEHNIYYTWENSDQRQINEVSLVRDALATCSILRAGATGSMAWNECDGVYGKLSMPEDGFRRRPASYLFRLLNEEVRGNLHAATSSNPAAVDVIAIRSGDWYKFVLVNCSQRDTPIRLAAPQGLPASVKPTSRWTLRRASVSGLTSSQVSHQDLLTRITLPKNSVTVLKINAK